MRSVSALFWAKAGGASASAAAATKAVRRSNFTEAS
jgi:hypothetical protein